jgi:hypothetical protein
MRTRLTAKTAVAGGLLAVCVVVMASGLRAQEPARTGTGTAPVREVTMEPDPLLYKAWLANVEPRLPGCPFRSKDSGKLAWQEALFLNGFIRIFEVTRDTKWLDLLTQHFDVMAYNLERNTDGRLAWQTASFSADKTTPYDYVVHDGEVLYPIARFIAAVSGDPTLARYQAQADAYRNLIETELIPKWDRYWRELPDDRGIYLFRGSPMSLPHNQYSSWGKMLLVVHRITGNQEYLDKATRLGRLFKSQLRLVDDHYEWHYWDPAGPWDCKEDGSPAHWVGTEFGGYHAMDVSFAGELWKAKVVFDDTDMQRFVNTHLKVMWNQSIEKPAFSRAVDGAPSKEDGAPWVAIAPFDPTAMTVIGNYYRKRPGSWGGLRGVPEYLWVQKFGKDAP